MFHGPHGHDGILQILVQLGSAQVESGLQVQPRLCVSAEIAAQAQRSISRDATTFQHDVIDTGGRYVQVSRQCICAQAQGAQVVLAEDLARVYRAHAILAHGYSFCASVRLWME